MSVKATLRSDCSSKALQKVFYRSQEATKGHRRPHKATEGCARSQKAVKDHRRPWKLSGHRRLHKATAAPNLLLTFYLPLPLHQTLVLQSGLSEGPAPRLKEGLNIPKHTWPNQPLYPKCIGQSTANLLTLVGWEEESQGSLAIFICP